MFVQRYCVYASPTEQAQLAQVAERGTTTQKVARRAQIVLMLAQQASPMVVARTLHVSRMTVRLWARRFVAEGVPGVPPRRHASGPAPTPDPGEGAGDRRRDPDDAPAGRHSLE